jgi:hypothetical protein
MTHTMEPMPVKIVKDPDESAIEAAHFGNVTTYQLAGTESGAAGVIRILPIDRFRRRAVILVNNPSGGAVAAAGSYVLIGSRGQVANGQGGRLQPGNSLLLENMQDWYLSADGTHALDVVVLQERYDIYDPIGGDTYNGSDKDA